MSHLAKALLALTLILSLNGCDNLLNPSPDDIRHARCKQIKHDIIFNGATTSQSEKWQQQAEMYKLQRSYQAEDCS